MSCARTAAVALVCASMIGAPPDEGACAPSSGAADPAEGSPAMDAVLQLAWTDPVEAAGGCGAATRETVVRLFKSMGVTARWRRADPDEPSRRDEVRVVLLDRVAMGGDGHHVLGARPLRGRAGIVWIHVPSVRERVATAVCGTDTAMDARQRLSIGLARVIAHEVVHAVAPQVPHGGGLMAPHFSSRDLTCPPLAIPDRAARAVRSAVAGGAP
jgi:hypothetical protein